MTKNIFTLFIPITEIGECMNNISFKAKFEGMDTPVIQAIFELRTKNDEKHKVVYVKDPNTYGEDKFELYKNGQKTAEYKTEIVNEKLFSINRLLGIFNILKTKEAQARIEEMKNKK